MGCKRHPKAEDQNHDLTPYGGSVFKVCDKPVHFRFCCARHGGVTYTYRNIKKLEPASARGALHKALRAKNLAEAERIMKGVKAYCSKCRETHAVWLVSACVRKI